jgi:hypothetical protein
MSSGGTRNINLPRFSNNVPKEFDDQFMQNPKDTNLAPFGSGS